MMRNSEQRKHLTQSWQKEQTICRGKACVFSVRVVLQQIRLNIYIHIHRTF